LGLISSEAADGGPQVMSNTVHADETARKILDSGGTNFTSFIFACLKQVDADPKTSAQELRLAFVISQMLNKKTRACFPLQSTLAERLGVSDREVRRCIAGLVDRGHLRVRHRGRDSSALYELVPKDRTSASGHDTVRQDTGVRSSENKTGHLRSHDRTFHTARPDMGVLHNQPHNQPHNQKERRAPQARRRRAPSGYVDSSSSEVAESEIVVDSGVAGAPPPDHLQRAVARARRLMQQEGGK